MSRPRPRPPLGQHFLSDATLLNNIANTLDPETGDVVLEIGAGRGALTRVLAPRVGTLVAIERDPALASALAQELAGSHAHVTIVQGDALRLDWHVLTGGVAAFKVIGNIPYYITSPLIEKALTPPLPRSVVFLVQREVADRLAAPPGSPSYGALSVGVQAAARVERLFIIKAGAFRPPPRVDSALVRLTPLERPLVTPEETAAFRAFVAACFSRRRKQLRNAVMAATGASGSAVAALLERLGLDPMSRPEVITPDGFARLLRASRQL